jgi:hypothetical protein
MAMAEGGLPARSGQPTVPRRSGELICERCHERMVPIPYFARGVNVAKAMLLTLTPFTLVGPILFFLWRKDRFVCTRCHKMLSVESPVAFLDAFSTGTRLALPAVELALARVNGAGNGALVPARVLADEVHMLERKGRSRRARAWMLGFVSAGSAAAAVLAGADAEITFATIAGLSGLGALWSGLRGSMFGRLADTKRRRQRMLQIVDLARAHQGRLNVTLVASHLQLELGEAEGVLDTMVDGHRVDIHVDDSGRVTYVFQELTDG